jgi:iron-sulfur cluster assembly accessory protein
MITLTNSAISHLTQLLLQQSAAEGSGLRLRVEKGGCAGMQYTMEVDQPESEDQVFESGGVAIIVDEASLPYLTGCRVDYVDSLNDSGFKIENPNATRNCGCGTSFEPRGTNEPALAP